MAGLVPAIHGESHDWLCRASDRRSVDARHEARHDGVVSRPHAGPASMRIRSIAKGGVTPSTPPLNSARRFTCDDDT